MVNQFGTTVSNYLNLPQDIFKKKHNWKISSLTRVLAQQKATSTDQGRRKGKAILRETTFFFFGF